MYRKEIIKTSVCDLVINKKAFINDIDCDPKLKKRLLALGAIEGTEITMKKIAPLGDPIIINFRGFDLAIRKKDAKHIYVNK